MADGNGASGGFERVTDATPGAFGVPGFIAPQSLEEIKELARMIALADWAPDCYRDGDGNYLQPKIELAILHGATVGLGPIAAVHAIALIGGIPSIWGDGALSVIEHSGLLEDMFEDYQVDDEEGLTAICSMKRRDRATPVVTRFSMAMAERAGLTHSEGPWQTYPERMLRMRARSWTMRDGFADVLRGLQLREEVEDYRAPRPAPSRRDVDRQMAANNAPLRHSPRPKFSVAAPAAPMSAALPSSTKEGDAPDDRPEQKAVPDNDVHDPRQTAPAPDTTAGCSGAGQAHPVNADQSLVIEINPTWGIQRIFQHYRAALTAITERGKQDAARVSQFRQANGSLEQRLRAKLPSRMREIDATYQRVGSTRSPPRKQRRSCILPREGLDHERRPTS